MALSARNSKNSLQYNLGAVPLQQAFWLQYIAVMLIILTFLIGSFCMKKDASTSDQSSLIPEEFSIANFQISDLFNSQEQLKVEVLLPFFNVLKMHDLSLRVEFAAQTAEQRELVLSRAIEISQLIAAEGLPPDAGQVVVLGRQQNANVVFKLLKLGDRETWN